MERVARIGDLVTGHTDIQGNPVTGVITTGSTKTFSGGVGIARNGDTVHFPSHPHDTVDGSPTDYQTHDFPITATSRHRSNGQKIARQGDLVVTGHGGNGVVQASTTKFYA